MKKQIIMMFTALYTLGAVSCIEEPELIPMGINISSTPTKATDSEFEQGDRVGLYVVNYDDTGRPGTFYNSGNHADNKLFSFQFSKWVPNEEIYWKDNTTKADFYCYYPYQGSIADVNMLSFAVNTDQSILTNYKSSDFLYGQTRTVAPTSEPVEITTHHLMSNFVIVLVAGTGYRDADIAGAVVTVKGVKTRADINLRDGSVSPVGGTSQITPLKETGQYRALLVPQELSNSRLVSIKLGGNTYHLTQSIRFESGKQHKATITINKTGEGLNIGIGDWEVDEIDYGETVE